MHEKNDQLNDVHKAEAEKFAIPLYICVLNIQMVCTENFKSTC